MNERIRELAEQCWVECKYGPAWFNQEKFAELIVRECAGIVYQTCRDGDAGAQAILYEFDIDNARSQK